MKKLILLIVILVINFLLLTRILVAQEPNDVVIPQDEFQVPWNLEVTDTHFELTNSEYLNITLDSSKPIKLMLESVPEMIIMHIESASVATSTEITISGFAPNTTYHKYEDDHSNHVAFTTDAEGKYSFSQDLSKEHLIFIQPRTSTIYLSNSGWSKPVGTWDQVTMTATLTQDVYETIQINSSGITLDGNGHIIKGSKTGFGVYLYYKTDVTVKNLNVTDFSHGIYLNRSNNNTIEGVTVSSNRSCGIYLYSSSSNTLTSNNASNNQFGIVLNHSGNNNLTDNVMSANTYNFYVSGTSVLHYIQTIDISNTVDGKTVYYLVDVSNLVIDSSADAGYVGVVNCTNVTVKDLTLTDNGQGVLFAYTSESSIENVTVSNNNFGIFLHFSNDNNLTSNTISSNNHGIYLHYSSYNDIVNNTTSNKNSGIYLNYSSYNNLTGNIANLNNYGLYLNRSNNNMLSGNTTSSNISYGIYLSSSSTNTLNSNNASNNQLGIILNHSGNSNLTDNVMSANTINFYVYGISVSHYAHTIDISNTVDGKPVYYFVDVSNLVIDSSVDAGYVGIVNGTNVTVKDLTLTNNGQGVLFAYTSESSIENVTVSNNNFGIFLYSSNDNNLTSNTISSNNNGIYLYYSSYNNLTGNIVDLNNHGLYINRSNNNNFIENTLNLNNYCGIYFYYYTTGSILTNNTISNNQYGINFYYYSNYNEIYNNNFINNQYQVYFNRSYDNIFNLDKPIGGNYWSDWTSPDDNGDGFVDNPYVFTGGQDNLPWTVMNGWLSAELAIENLITDVENLGLNEGNTNSLTKKLDNTISSLEKENNNAAINKLNSFINEVNDFIPQKISTEDGQALIDAANRIINQISGSITKRGITGQAAAQPLEYALEQNYPNPFNPETKIRYQLPNASEVSLKIYNLMGQEVKTLVNTYHAAGYYSVKWDGTNNLGMKAASGIYIYTLQAGSFVDVKRMVLLR